MSTKSSEPSPGSTRSYEVIVQPADLASGIASDVTSDPFPRVLATSRLIAFMEIAASRVLQPHLDSTQLSVGTRVDITHMAPTPVGSKVLADAKFVGMNEKLYLFEVFARDETGEIGRGTHKRAIVDTARLENRAQKRLQTRAL